MQAFDLITEVLLGHLAREKELHEEFVVHLQEPSPEETA